MWFCLQVSREFSHAVALYECHQAFGHVVFHQKVFFYIYFSVSSFRELGSSVIDELETLAADEFVNLNLQELIGDPEPFDLVEVPDPAGTGIQFSATVDLTSFSIDQGEVDLDIQTSDSGVTLDASVHGVALYFDAWGELWSQPYTTSGSLMADPIDLDATLEIDLSGDRPSVLLTNVAVVGHEFEFTLDDEALGSLVEIQAVEDAVQVILQNALVSIAENGRRTSVRVAPAHMVPLELDIKLPPIGSPFRRR